MIEILDDDEEDAIDEYEREEVLVKMEPNREAERAEAGAPDGPRRSNRARIANQQFEDYELYVTVEEEELMMATMGNNPAEEEEMRMFWPQWLIISWFTMKIKREEKDEKEVQAKIWAVPAGGRD